MMQLTQATSKGDISEAASPPIHTPEQAFQAAATYVNAPEQEWLVILCLTRESRLIDQHLIFLSSNCRECPDDAFLAFLSAAQRSHPYQLKIVRQHIHPWRGPRTPGMRRLLTWRRLACEQGISVPEAFVADSTGEIYSLLGEPVSAPVMHRPSAGCPA